LKSPRRRTATGFAAVFTIGAIAAAAPLSAQATAPNECTGSLSKGPATEKTSPGDHPVDFTFGCVGPITGFSIITNKVVESFDTDLKVFLSGGNLIEKEAFACEGDLPGHGVNCNGTYNGQNHLVKGTFMLHRQQCSKPRLDALLVVDYATADKKGVISDSVAGPFDLKGPKGCRGSRRPGILVNG
jgi:hypothetical protein